jgi:hypothetical protein
MIYWANWAVYQEIIIISIIIIIIIIIIITVSFLSSCFNSILRFRLSVSRG